MSIRALDRRRLEAHVLGRTLLETLTHPVAPAELAQNSDYTRMLAACAQGMSVARAIGKADFLGREFFINDACLEPRPCTEHLVHLAAQQHQKHNEGRALRVLDVGTGCGVILLSFLMQLAPTYAGKILAVGIDNNRAALAMAVKNARALGFMPDEQGDETSDVFATLHNSAGNIQLSFVCRDVLATDSPYALADEAATYDLVLSNPPYVAPEDEVAADVLAFDPHEALFAGAQGLAFYHHFAEHLPAVLARGAVVILEHGAEQASAIQRVFAAWGWRIEAHKDEDGWDRFAVISQTTE